MVVKNNRNKIKFILFLLIISNIILFIGLIRYYYYVTNQIEFSLDYLNSIFAMVSTIIIFGFISTRLPQFRRLGDSSFYEIGYLIIIGLFSISLSYFNQSTNTQSFFAPYLDMFKVLSVMLIFTLVATKSKAFKEIIKGNISKKSIIVSVVIFSVLGILSSLYIIPVNMSFANVRNLIITVAGLFGGPYVGIPSAIISGIFRYSQGGITALPCSLATIIVGIIASLIHYWNGGKFLQTRPAVLLMFLFTGFEMLLIVMLTPPSISFGYIEDIYLLMVFASVGGMLLFSMIIKEEIHEDKSFTSYEELQMREFRTMFEEFDEKIEKLENEVRELKKQSGKNSKEDSDE